MNEQDITRPNGNAERSSTLRDYLGVVFRHRRAVVLCFLGSFLGVVLFAVFVVAHRYQAQMKVLVKHERATPVSTPVVTPAASEQLQVNNDQLSEEEVNTEVSLLQSRDVLEKVVMACGLENRKTAMDYLARFRQLTTEQRVALAVRRLAKRLGVEPEKKANLIDVTYVSDNPQLAARVLDTLSKFYLEKHLEVHHWPQASDFFREQAAAYEKELAEDEERLASYDRGAQAVSSPLERDTTVQKLTEFVATLGQTETAAAETRQRIRELEHQLAATPSRVETQVQAADPAQLLAQDRTTLLGLQMKRTELLTKFDPGYPLVQEVDRQIAETAGALADAEKRPMLTTTTDYDPTHELLREELAKARADLATYQGRAAATAAVIRGYRGQALKLDQQALDQQDLLRKARANEENYLLYLRKREEARIADALDATHIVNAAIAQPPIAPVFPEVSPWTFGLLGLLFSVVVSVGAAFVAEYLDPSFRTPDEVVEFLEVPVFASIPRDGK